MRLRSAGLIAAVAALTVGALLWRPSGSASTFAPREPILATPLRVAFETGLDSLIVALDSLQATTAGNDRSRSLAAFRSTRTDYKRVEGLVEYFAPGVAGFLNGPLPDDDGDAPPRPLGAPAAFQRVEVALAGDVPMAGGSTPRGPLKVDVVAMRRVVVTLRAEMQFISVGELEMLDAARLEIARVTTLGLAGVDAGASDNALSESAEALEGMRSLIRTEAATAPDNASRERWAAIDTTLGNAATQLRQEHRFDHLDRLTFIAQFAAPASLAVARMRVTLARRAPPRRRVWRDDAPSVFDTGALDASAYAPEYAPSANPALIALGRRLFFDPRLSGPKTRSCVSCHDPAKAFTDGQARAHTLTASGQATARNTPTLWNSAFQPRLFADERAGSLEEQVALVLASQAEMQSSAQLAASRLREDASYRAEFARALWGRPDSVVTELSVRVALAAYVRSLAAFNSRFDRAARGDTTALSPRERAGFTLFMGKARCGSCHFAPLFNGTMPPTFTTSEPEIIGVRQRVMARDAILDSDPGRAGVDHIELHRFAFKVPTLRNIALTAPYMHNGAFTTLEQVVDFYNRGGGVGLRAPRPVLTLSAQPLHLTDQERRALVAFLRALTDTVVAPPTRPSVASRLPRDRSVAET